MKKFRYNTLGQWFKGNTHLHSVVSDGGLTFPEIERRYLQTGHDFLCRTDHRIASDCISDDFESTILWIDGVELDGVDETGSYYHVISIGSPESQTDGMSFNEALNRNRKRDTILILAHPHWTGNDLDDALRWDFDGVEVYNHIGNWLNGRGHSLIHWEAMLKLKPDSLGFSADDAHLTSEHPPMNGGWVMVNAPGRNQESIISAIRAGNFYSSCGPEIHSISFDEGSLHAVFSPSQYVHLVGPGFLSVRAPYCSSGESLTEFSFTIEPEEWDYIYFEVVDSNGRRAWTNNLFTEK